MQTASRGLIQRSNIWKMEPNLFVRHKLECSTRCSWPAVRKRTLNIRTCIQLNRLTVPLFLPLFHIFCGYFVSQLSLHGFILVILECICGIVVTAFSFFNRPTFSGNPKVNFLRIVGSGLSLSLMSRCRQRRQCTEGTLWTSAYNHIANKV